jgi:hypothetical protein
VALGPVWTGAENLTSHRDSIPGPSSQASRYTNRAIPALTVTEVDFKKNAVGSLSHTISHSCGHDIEAFPGYSWRVGD